MTWQNTSIAISTLEAFFYAALRGGIMETGGSQTRKCVNWCRETAICHVNTIQNLFGLANVGLIALSAKQLFNDVNGQHAVWIPLAGATVLGWGLTNRFSTSLAPPETMQGEDEYTQNNAPVVVNYTVDVVEKFSLEQRIAKGFHIAKLVLNVAIACFAKNRLWAVISLVMTSYSLWKNIRLKWVTFTRAFSCRIIKREVPVTQLTPTYQMLALPPNAQAVQAECPVCFDPFEATDAAQEPIAFCVNHVFHKACLARLVHAKSRQFANVDDITKTITDHYQNGRHTGTSRKYSIVIQHGKLPGCPTCREIPLHNRLSIAVLDRDHGTFNAVVTIKRPPVDRQYLFENLYAIYNTVQAGLAFLQTYPSLAGPIYNVQNVMLVTDFIGSCLSTFYLCNKVNGKANPNHSQIRKIGIVAGVGLTGALSWLFMRQINAFLKPAILLNDFLPLIDRPADVLKTLDFSFNAPEANKLAQVLLIYRVMTSIALTVFSQQRKTNLLSVMMQLASLMGISTLKWIEVVQRLNMPLQTVVARGGKLLGSLTGRAVTSSKVTHHFLVSSSCLTHLQSTMKAIADFTENFFNGSVWFRYWQVSYTNGVETGRKLFYSITLKNKAAEACGCTLIPYLTDTTIKLVDALQGATNGVIVSRA